jgi:hypothetical protein
MWRLAGPLLETGRTSAICYDFSNTFAADCRDKIGWVDFENALENPSFNKLYRNLLRKR